MSEEEAAAVVGGALALAVRIADAPVFRKVAHQDNVVAIETFDGSLFELRITPAERILWPIRSNDND